MSPNVEALLTSKHQGLALPDRVQVSVFADAPRAFGETSAQTAHAARYFRARPGAAYHDDPDDPTGPSFAWREGPVTLKLGIKDSFSLAATFNPQRMATSRHGLPGAHGRHGNTALPLLAEGYTVAGLRLGMAEDIADTVARVRRRYPDIVAKALGVPVVGGVHANWSAIELAYDFGRDPAVIGTYDRAFRKVFRVGQNATGLSGCLRQGEHFAVYPKDHIVRFEIRVTGRRIKQATGSQRVPGTASEVANVLDVLEAHYLPVLLELERHRLPGSGGTLGHLVMSLPRVRDRDALDRIARQLGLTGRIKSVKSNRAILDSLRKRGLVENLLRTTGVRGYRVSSPESETLWRLWGKRA